MLHLAEASASDWGRRALAHVDEILLDHAHCENKAATAVIAAAPTEQPRVHGGFA